MSFPSDNVTLGMVRNLFPHQFDGAWPTVMQEVAAGTAGSLLEHMIGAEREYARLTHAFHSGIRLNTSETDDMQGFKNDLLIVYQNLGLASGPFHAHELIKKIENQARAQTVSSPSP